jgi:hypothetical protein
MENSKDTTQEDGIMTFAHCEFRVPLPRMLRFSDVPQEANCGAIDKKKRWIYGTYWTCELRCATGMCQKNFSI